MFLPKLTQTSEATSVFQAQPPLFFTLSSFWMSVLHGGAPAAPCWCLFQSGIQLVSLGSAQVFCSWPHYHEGLRMHFFLWLHFIVTEHGDKTLYVFELFDLNFNKILCFFSLDDFFFTSYGKFCIMSESILATGWQVPFPLCTHKTGFM